MEKTTNTKPKADTFTKKIGTRTAIEHFRAGQTVFLPAQFFDRYFG